MSDATYPKTSKTPKVTRVSKVSGTPKASAQPADDYEYEDSEYDEPYYDDEEEYEYEEESGPGLLASPGRAVLLGFSAVALLAVFAVVIWLMTSQPKKVIDDGSVATGSVPVIKGFVQTNETQAPTKGAFAPDFMWADSNNHDVALSSFRGDKPVFVNFWGTWCPPCRAEMPAMESFYQKHKDEIQMIGVSMYPRDDPTTVLTFVKDAKYSWNFIHDGDYKVAEKYQVASVPSSYFIDRNGIIKAVQIGAMTDEKMIENNFQQVK